MSEGCWSLFCFSVSDLPGPFPKPVSDDILLAVEGRPLTDIALFGGGGGSVYPVT